MFPCSWKETLGIDCPSCGAQRSFEALLHGELLKSLLLFPALIPLMLVILITGIHLVQPLKAGPQWIVRLFAFSAGLMLAGWIWKLF